MSDVITFPGATPAPEVHAELDIDTLHAEAFRDLEGRISDCAHMAWIALQQMEHLEGADEKHSRAMFAVCQTAVMLQNLKKDHQALWCGEKVQL